MCHIILSIQSTLDHLHWSAIISSLFCTEKESSPQGLGIRVEGEILSFRRTHLVHVSELYHCDASLSFPKCVTQIIVTVANLYWLENTMFFSTPGLFNSGTMDILDQIILCHGETSCALEAFLSATLRDADSTPPLPCCYPEIPQCLLENENFPMGDHLSRHLFLFLFLFSCCFFYLHVK